MSGCEADNFSCSFTGVRIGNTSEAFTIVNIIFTVVSFREKSVKFTPWTSQPAVINFVQRDSRVPSLLNLKSLFSLVSHQHPLMLGFFTLCKFWLGPISGSSTPPAPPTPSVPHISHALSNFNLTKPLDRTGALLCILCFSSAFFSEK